MEENKKQIIEKVFGIGTLVSMFIPICFLPNNGHNCEINDCMMIFYHDKLGCCVEKSINDLCLYLAVLWNFAILGGALVLSKSKSSVSPFVFIGVLLAVSVFAALLDPSKWKFFFASLCPAIMFTISAIYDGTKKT